MEKDIKSQIRDLENMELDVNGGIISESSYTRLFILYLVNNDFISPKFLYKRMPEDIKNQPDIKFLHMIWQKLSNKDFDKILNPFSSYTWSNIEVQYYETLRENILNQILFVVSKVYAQVSINTLANLLDMEPNELIPKCTSLNWKCDFNSHMIKLSPTGLIVDPVIENDKHLKSLIKYVTFFEN